MSVVIGVLLVLAVAVTWLAALALWRLPRALDRLHALAFLNVSASALVVGAAFLADGVSGRSLKILLMMVVCQRDMFADKIWNRDRSFVIVVGFLRTVVSDIEGGEFPGNRLRV